ncbi:MAG: S-layer homology domain-containing protein [Clostridia bacterium]|nr:S-layer homology domain-containing protein [Clostridia bacterium]
MKRALTLASAALLLALCFGIFAGAASLGCGVEVLSAEASAVKTAKAGEKIKLCEEDFKSALAVTDFDSVTVTRLPKSSEGTLLLAGRRVKEGQTVKRRALVNLVFVPESKEVREASFGFVMNGAGAGEEVCFRLRFIDGGNGAPSIAEAASAALSVSTQSGIPLYGRLSGEDPDGDAVEFIPVIFPKNGSLSITDKSSGEYKYTPRADFCGTDAFGYVLRDEYGNYSEVARVSVTVGERFSSVVLLDMQERSEYGAAVAMCALGIMSPSERGGLYYFSPEERVTRAEFVMMAMKACGLSPTAELSPFFDDAEDIPEPLAAYVALAASVGIVDGDFGTEGLVFRPNDTVTKEEAAVIIARLLGIEGGEEAVLSPIDGVRPWASGQVWATVTLGIFDYSDGGFSGDTPLCRADVAECLYRLVKVK